MSWGGSGYQGANFSTNRGYIYWPTLDPRREIDTYSRLEIARRVHFLCANTGFPKRIIEGLANLIVGTGLSPQATTKDKKWNQLAQDSYWSRSHSASTYDVSARLTGVQAQRLMVKTRLRDGDAAVVLSSSQSGGALRGFYSGIQVGNPSNANNDGWIDGLKTDSLNRISAYRLMDANGEKSTDIPAESMCWLVRYDSPGQLRSISILAHAVNKMVDITEIGTATTQGIKTAAQVGYYIASQAAANTSGGSMLQAIKQAKQAGLPVPSNDVTAQKIFQVGSGGEIMELPVGREIKTLLDTRPHPNTMEFIDYLIRDISWGTGISSDLLWNIYKLGGANTRFVMADAQTYVQTEQQDLVDTWLARDWVYHCAKEMKAGRLPRCSDPSWWLHNWVTPERITVDFGRDGQVILKKWASMLLSTERVFQMAGQDAREELSKEMDLTVWIKEEMAARKLTPVDFQIFRNSNITQMLAQNPPPDPETTPATKPNPTDTPNPEEPTP